MFFCFDGLDGVGKSTQRRLFIEWLTAAGHDVVDCIDPGSTLLGTAIREILLGGKMPIARTSEMLLFMAARAQLVDEVIRPELASGKTIVSDRYLLANIVYQGYAGGLDVETIRQIGQAATAGIMPEMIFLLDMPPTAAAGRNRGARSTAWKAKESTIKSGCASAFSPRRPKILTGSS